MRIFTEEQRFKQTWLIIVMAISAVFSIGLVINQYIKNPESMSPTELLFIISIILFATGFIFLFKLKSRIDEVGIHYQFVPFHLKSKSIEWRNISKAYVRKYDAISEYGGWGLKGGVLWSKKKGIAINVSGNIGIQLELKNGKKVLIGTNKESEAKQVLKTYNHG